MTSDDTTPTDGPVSTGTQEVVENGSDTASAAQEAPVNPGTPQSATPVPTTNDTGTITPPVQNGVTNQPPAAPVDVNWQERHDKLKSSYDHIRTYANQTKNQFDEMRKQYEGLDPQAARQALQFYEQQKQNASLSPFSRRHPDYQQNRSRIERAEMAVRAVEGLPPEQQAAIAQRMGVTKADIELREQAHQHREQMTEQLLSDPDSFIAERVESLVTSRIQEYDRYRTAAASSEQWMQQQAPLVEKFAPQMYQMMDPNVPAQQKALEYAKALAENAALKAQLNGNVEQVTQAQAQKAIVSNRMAGASRRAAPSGDGNPRIDPAKILREKNIKPTDPGYASELRRLIESQT